MTAPHPHPDTRELPRCGIRYDHRMTSRSDALELDSAVVPIDDREPLVPVDVWLAKLRDGEPLVGAPPAAELVDQARSGE